MTTNALPAVPRRAVVVREQMRAVGLALRPGATAITVLLALLTVLLLWSWIEARREGSVFGFRVSPGLAVPGVLLGLIVPLFVWKMEYPSRRSYLWSLPVERSVHQAAKSGSGWAWYMGSMAVYLLWAAVLGSVIGIHPATRSEWARIGPTPAWQWVVPFVAGTATYLAGTAAALLSRHPWRWTAGLVIAYLTVGVFLNVFGLREAAEIWESLVDGRFGLEILMTGEAESVVESTRGEPAPWPRNHPAPLEWLISVAIWLSAATVAAVAALYRHQEP